MNFKYNVTSTTQITPEQTGFIFAPTQLEIFVENKETIQKETENVEVVNIHTILTQFLIDGSGTIKQDRMIKMPMDVVSNMFDGFDTVNMQPIISTTALQSVLLNYQLELK